ncbi:Rep family protein [Nesterenkonia populi]|uniref:Rep family protein n=1 Tax=Nesterenkonia populi TaxID=1591087 RepID=UPI0011BD5B32
MISVPKQQNPTIIGVTQYLDPKYWDWADANTAERKAKDGTIVSNRLGLSRQAAIDLVEYGTAEQLTDYVVQRLEHKGDFFASGGEDKHPGTVVGEAYGIIHDRDEREVWDEARGESVTELKPRHIHMVIKFKDRKASAPLGYLAKRIGVAAQYVEKPGRGAHAYDNMLAYLIHIKYDDKFQYEPADVATVRGRDYTAVYQERRADWLKGRAQVKKKKAAEDIEDLREKILNGELTESQIVLTDELYETYKRHPEVCDKAFEVYAKRRAYRAAAKLRNGDYKIMAAYIHGDAGAGKTRFANGMISEAIRRASERGELWQVYRVATGNPMDDWKGEEIVLLDDLRASAMDANDWLLLLDPYNASPAKARYKNKAEVAPRMIVITATIEPVEFFFYARQKGQVDEALDQFIRRLQSIVQVYREDDIQRYLVSQVGKVQSYQRRLVTSGPGGVAQHNTLSLTYGSSEVIECTAEGATAALLHGLAGASPDVGFAEAADWSQLPAPGRDLDLAVERAMRRQEAEDLAYADELAKAAGRSRNVFDNIPSPWDQQSGH